jgi:hypothetical protein
MLWFQQEEEEEEKKLDRSCHSLFSFSAFLSFDYYDQTTGAQLLKRKRRKKTRPCSRPLSYLCDSLILWMCVYTTIVCSFYRFFLFFVT